MHKYLACVVLLVPSVCLSATYCVNDNSTFTAALAQAQSSTEDDIIRIQQGDYSLAASLYFPDGPTEGSVGGLVLEGGWNNGCGLHTPGAQRTRFTATEPYILLTLNPDGNLEIKDLSFYEFGDNQFRSSSSNSTVSLKRVAIINQTNAIGDALTVFTPSKDILIDHLLIDTTARFCALQAAPNTLNGNPQGASVKIINSNFINHFQNATSVVDWGYGACIYGGANRSIRISNSIFQTVLGGALVGYTQQSLVVTASIYSDNTCSAGCSPNPFHPDSSLNQMGSVVFENGDSPYQRNLPAAGSLAIDAGQFVAGMDYDLLGNPRVVNGLSDIGAIERTSGPSNLIFGSGFE